MNIPCWRNPEIHCGIMCEDCPLYFGLEEPIEKED